MREQDIGCYTREFLSHYFITIKSWHQSWENQSQRTEEDLESPHLLHFFFPPRLKLRSDWINFSKAIFWLADHNSSHISSFLVDTLSLNLIVWSSMYLLLILTPLPFHII